MVLQHRWCENVLQIWVLQGFSKWLHVWQNLWHCKMKFLPLGVWMGRSAACLLLRPSEWQPVCQNVMGVGRPLLPSVSAGSSSDYSASVNDSTGRVRIHCRTGPSLTKHWCNVTGQSWLSEKPAVIPAGDSFWHVPREFDTVMDLLPLSCHPVSICVCLCHSWATWASDLCSSTADRRQYRQSY